MPEEPSVVRLVGLMALFVLLGVPMVAFLWETLHEILTLRPDPVRIAIAVPVLGLFGFLLVSAGRRYRRETAQYGDQGEKEQNR